MNMKYFYLLFFLISSYSFSQGSGRCLLYDGASSYTQISDDPMFSSHLGGQISVEAWIKVEAINTDGHGQTRQPVVAKGNSGSWEWALYVYDNLSIGFSSWQCSGSGHSEISGGSIVLGQWHHVAASFDDGNFNRVYIDGELVVTGTSFSGSACDGVRPVRIGSREDGQYLNAQIDEVRIWNKALTQTEIRDNMCKKLTGAEANLTAYYRIDETADNTCNATDDVCDATVNGFHGANFNSPTRLYSGAAIGDASAYDYTNSWGGKTIGLTSVNNGNFEVSNISGSPVGIHVYRVDSPPNSVLGIPFGIGSNTTYYGTFIARYPSAGFSMQVTYDYTNYPDAIANENNLVLYARDMNSDMTWFDDGAVLNTTANTLINNSESIRLEYIIALNNGALPITLSAFNATKYNDRQVKINWITESEINNDYFIVERSNDGKTWQEIKKVDGAGNSSSKINYSIIDYSPNLSKINYYRLKQIDYNGDYSYSKIKSVSFKGDNDKITIYPNPTTNIATINLSNNQFNEINITDVNGKIVYQSSVNNSLIQIDLSNFPIGVYFVQLINEEGVKSLKIIKQ